MVRKDSLNPVTKVLYLGQLTRCGFVLQGLLSVVHVPGETVRRHLDWVFLSLFPEADSAEWRLQLRLCALHDLVAYDFVWVFQ